MMGVFSVSFLFDLTGLWPPLRFWLFFSARHFIFLIAGFTCFSHFS